jgi:D-glycero-alpha-D-manno-heptose-7-phosphate kinase
LAKRFEKPGSRAALYIFAATAAARATRFTLPTASSSAPALTTTAATAYADLCAARIDALGTMLHEAWQIKKQMTNGITNTLIDEAYQAAIDAGAEGGKLLGAGDGGFLMFPAPPGRHNSIRRALQALREPPFRFASQGSNIIFVH